VRKASRLGKRSFVRQRQSSIKKDTPAQHFPISCEATGLEKGRDYRHFESKEELAGDAFDHAWKVDNGCALRRNRGDPESVDRLKQIVRNFRDRRTGLVPGGCRC